LSIRSRLVSQARITYRDTRSTTTFRADITIPLDVAGGYDLAFALDGKRVQQHTLALSVIVRE